MPLRTLSDTDVLPNLDRRYAIDATKLTTELGWQAAENFETGIERTVRWYLDHQPWVAHVKDGSYRHWIERQYADRGGDAAGDDAATVPVLEGHPT